MPNISGHCRVTTFNPVTQEVIQSVEGKNTITNAFIEWAFARFIGHTTRACSYAGLSVSQSTSNILSTQKAPGLANYTTCIALMPDEYEYNVDTAIAPYQDDVTGMLDENKVCLYMTLPTNVTPANGNIRMALYPQLSTTQRTQDGWRLKWSAERALPTDNDMTIKSVCVGAQGALDTHYWTAGIDGGFQSSLLSGLNLPVPIFKDANGIMRVEYWYDLEL